jgi:PIN domain nuclease of toxin-antitoxin system
LVGALLDTHALYWLVSGEKELTDDTLVAIGESQEAGMLLVSAITAWELAISTQKPRLAGRPHLGEVSPERWFREAVRAAAGRIVPIQQRIASEAANVVSLTGHKDPGDCFLIATAHARSVPLITRDGIIQAIAAEHDDYLSVIVC